jgi:hypothetical protein
MILTRISTSINEGVAAHLRIESSSLKQQHILVSSAETRRFLTLVSTFTSLPGKAIEHFIVNQVCVPSVTLHVVVAQIDFESKD